MPEELRVKISEWLGAYEGPIVNAIIAGGWLRDFYAGDRPKDLDLFFENAEDLAAVESYLRTVGFREELKTDNAISFVGRGLFGRTVLVQLVTYRFDSPEGHLSGFDFTVSQCALHKGEVICHADFFEHLAGRKLVYTQEYKTPALMLRRLVKYTRKRYNIDNEQCILIAKAIKDHDISESLLRMTKPHSGGSYPK
jgi:hypothetical protein